MNVSKQSIIAPRPYGYRPDDPTTRLRLDEISARMQRLDERLSRMELILLELDRRRRADDAILASVAWDEEKAGGER